MSTSPKETRRQMYGGKGISRRRFNLGCLAAGGLAVAGPGLVAAIEALPKIFPQEFYKIKFGEGVSGQFVYMSDLLARFPQWRETQAYQYFSREYVFRAEGIERAQMLQLTLPPAKQALKVSFEHNYSLTSYVPWNLIGGKRELFIQHAVDTQPPVNEMYDAPYVFGTVKTPITPAKHGAILSEPGRREADDLHVMVGLLYAPETAEQMQAIMCVFPEYYQILRVDMTDKLLAPVNMP